MKLLKFFPSNQRSAPSSAEKNNRNPKSIEIAKLVVGGISVTLRPAIMATSRVPQAHNEIGSMPAAIAGGTVNPGQDDVGGHLSGGSWGQADGAGISAPTIGRGGGT